MPHSVLIFLYFKLPLYFEVASDHSEWKTFKDPERLIQESQTSKNISSHENRHRIAYFSNTLYPHVSQLRNINFQPEHSELKGWYFQVRESQSERLPTLCDRVQNCRPARFLPPILRQDDELNHPSVDGSPSHTSETATSFWNAATPIGSYVLGIYTFMFLSSIYKPSCIHECPSSGGHFPKLCQQSMSEHMMILYNPGYFTRVLDVVFIATNI